MHGASTLHQEWAFPSLHTQTDRVLCGIDIHTLKLAGAHSLKRGQTGHIFHAQIDETLLCAAARASGLAGETHRVDSG